MCVLVRKNKGKRCPHWLEEDGYGMLHLSPGPVTGLGQVYLIEANLHSYIYIYDVCMYIYIYRYTYMQIYIYIYVYIYISSNMYKYRCLKEYIHRYTYV